MGEQVPKGKAKYPHNSKRPAPKKVIRAIEEEDIEGLKVALTPRQRIFCKEYLVDYNASAAAVRAGYAINYSDRQAHILLKHKGVARLIDALSESKEAKITSVSPDYVIQKVTEIVTKEGTRDGDKLRGLELLARHLGMFIDRTEITGKDGGAIELEQRRIEQEAQHFTSKMKALRDRAVLDEDKVVAIK